MAYLPYLLYLPIFFSFCVYFSLPLHFRGAFFIVFKNLFSGIEFPTTKIASSLSDIYVVIRSTVFDPGFWVLAEWADHSIPLIILLDIQISRLVQCQSSPINPFSLASAIIQEIITIP